LETKTHLIKAVDSNTDQQQEATECEMQVFILEK